MFKLLVVDDNPTDCSGLVELVDWTGLNIHEIKTAKNGREGLDTALSFLPDLILTDVSMPVMDGIDMAKEIKRTLPETKFVFMSCFEEVEYIKAAVDVNAYGYIVKPVNIKKLLETVKNVLQIRGNELENQKKVSDLEREVSEFKPQMREQFVRELLYGSIPADDTAHACMKRLGIPADGYFAVFLMQANDSDEAQSADEKKYYEIYRIKKIMESEGSGVYIFLQSSKSLAGLVPIGDAADENEAFNILLDKLSLWQNDINSQLGTGVTFIIGGVSENIGDVSVFYESAESVLENRMTGEKNSIVRVSEIKDNTGDFFDSINLKDELIRLVDSGDEEKIREFIADCYGDGGILSERTAKGSCIHIISTLQLILNERGESFKSIFDSEMLVWNKLLNFETIVDLRQWLFNIIMSVSKLFGEQLSSRYGKIVEEIKSIIEQEYATIENIGQISKKVYLSINYVNSIFKKETGKTIFDYLIYIRMEKAKELLKNPYCKVYEVAEAVGYKSTNYFTSLFKQYVGVKPMEYRSKGI